MLHFTKQQTGNEIDDVKEVVKDVKK